MSQALGEGTLICHKINGPASAMVVLGDGRLARHGSHLSWPVKQGKRQQEGLEAGRALRGWLLCLLVVTC